jgi:hypothetical protein
MPMSISMLASLALHPCQAISPTTSLTTRKSSNRTRSDTTRTFHKPSQPRGGKGKRIRRPSTQTGERWESWESGGSSSGHPSLDSGVRPPAATKALDRHCSRAWASGSSASPRSRSRSCAATRHHSNRRSRRWC